MSLPHTQSLILFRLLYKNFYQGTLSQTNAFFIIFFIYGHGYVVFCSNLIRITCRLVHCVSLFKTTTFHKYMHPGFTSMLPGWLFKGNHAPTFLSEVAMRSKCESASKYSIQLVNSLFWCFVAFRLVLIWKRGTLCSKWSFFCNLRQSFSHSFCANILLEWSNTWLDQFFVLYNIMCVHHGQIINK